MKKICALLALLLVTFVVFSACADDQSKKNDGTSNQQSANSDSNSSSAVGGGSDQNGATVNGDQMFTERDTRVEYDKSNSVNISLNKNSISCSSEAVSINGSTVTIKDKGTYVISGTLDNGMIVVNAEATDKLQIVLNNASVKSETSSPIYIKQAEKVFLTLDNGTKNRLENGGKFVAVGSEAIDAVIYSTADITLNGSGSLTVDSPAGHGISTKDDLVITGGTYTVNSALRGLDANDSIRLKDANIQVVSGKDSLKVENLEDTDKGYVYINSGTFTLTSNGDAISASSYIHVENGSFNITTSSTDTTLSLKALKSATDIIVKNGTFIINSMDDALHSDNMISIQGGTFELSSDDDAINGYLVQIGAGDIKIIKSKNGVCGKDVEITGGKLDITSDNDAISAEGIDENGNPTNEGIVLISGGQIIANAKGDCIQVKGKFYLSGGHVELYASNVGGAELIDYDVESKITGGFLVGFSSVPLSQKLTSPTQGVGYLSDASYADKYIEICDASNNNLLLVKNTTPFTYILVTDTSFKKGDKCNINIKDTSAGPTEDIISITLE